MNWRDFFLVDPYSGAKIVEHDLQGWGSDDPMFEQVLAAVRPTTIIEVGSWKGRSAANMMAICKRLGLDARLLCIDTWLGSHENYARHDGDNRWLHEALRLEAGYPRLHELFLSNMMHLGLTERVTPLPLPATIAARVVAEKNIVADVIYIDGSHDYEDCKADLANYWPLLRQGGILFGDDYQAWPGVTRAVDEFCDAHFLHRSVVRRSGKFAFGKDRGVEGIA
jgi:hypothetical protein